MVIKLLGYCFFFIFLGNCNNSEISNSNVEINKFKESKNKFKKEKERFNNCKNEYENLSGHKIIIDVKNGSGVDGLAKKTSDYFRDLCYDTYYGNWVKDNQVIKNEYYSHIIIHKQDKKIQKQLKKDIDSSIKLYTELAPNKEADITLVIGQNYRKLDFFKKMKQ
tara:strand:- start:3871 stop:4365 length:495 start_codon:yes stop_codon:yes gene_type:complete